MSTREMRIREIEAYLIGYENLCDKNNPPPPLTRADWCIYGPFGTVDKKVDAHKIAVSMVG